MLPSVVVSPWRKIRPATLKVSLLPEHRPLQVTVAERILTACVMTSEASLLAMPPPSFTTAALTKF
jgi:hypothetical protein